MNATIEFKTRAMTPAEHKYSFAQSPQITMQTGLIGYLRADMDTDGYGFFSTWSDINRSLKSDEFKTEFDLLINSLRAKGHILHSRHELSKYCYSPEQSPMPAQYGSCYYGVRIDSAKWTYLLRLNPNKGEYNVYCYAYKRDWLELHLFKASQGIRFIYPNYKERFIADDGDKVRIVLPNGNIQDYTARYIDEYHVQLDGAHGSDLYHICELAERLERSNAQDVIPLRASLPDQCYSIVQTTGEIVILNKGETGYYRANIPFTNSEEARNLVDTQNKRMGVTRAQEEAMKTGSMFGFAVPGANPIYYDEITGKPRMPRR